MTKIRVSVFAVMLLVLIGIGFLTRSMWLPLLVAPPQVTEETVTQLPVESTEDSNTEKQFGNLVGTIKSSSGNTFIITVQDVTASNINPELLEREVVVNADTKMFRIEEVAVDTQNDDIVPNSPSEVGVSLIRPRIGTSTDTQSAPFAPVKSLKRSAVAFADVKVGDLVNVVTLRKMLTERQFIAEVLEVLPLPVAEALGAKAEPNLPPRN